MVNIKGCCKWLIVTLMYVPTKFDEVRLDNNGKQLTNIHIDIPGRPLIGGYATSVMGFAISTCIFFYPSFRICHILL